MGTDVKILAVAAGSASAAVGAGLLLARWIPALAAPGRRRLGPARRRRPRRPRARAGGPSEIAELADVVQHDGGEHRAALRRAPRARRLGEPRPAHAARLDAGDDRGDRGRPRRPAEDYLPTLREQVRTLTTLVDDLFELARIDAGALTLELQQTPLAGARRLGAAPAPARGRRPQRRPRRPPRAASRAHASPPTRSSACSSTCSRTRSATPRRTARSRSASPQLAGDVARLGRGHGQRPRPRGARRGCSSASGAPTGPARAPGTGLGLAIARGLVEAHGGRIWAENRAQGGARISFTLPAAPV